MASVVPIESYERSPDAFMLIDGCGTIRMLNEPAAALLGCDRRRAIGCRCWEIVGLKTIGGANWCRPDCAIRRRARSGESSLRFQAVHPGSETPVTVDVFTTVVPPHEGEPLSVLHMIVPRQVRRKAHGESVTQEEPSPARENLLETLSPREREVLGELARGRRTREVAEELSLSPATVRNHVRAILRKLEVHRRLEAVLLWLGRVD